MEYLVDALTRAPTQVLVKSATQFGEDAAKVMGEAIEESLKSCTETITASIKENISTSGVGISKELDKLSQVLKETAVEGFTEWGIGIERAFYHLGHKLENGLNNTANRLAVQLDESIGNNLSKIGLTVRDSVEVFSSSFLKDQVPHWRLSFLRELNILMVCLLLVSIGIFILCVSWAFGGYQIVGHILMHEFSTLCFLIFAVINGFSLYIWSQSLKEENSANITNQNNNITSSTSSSNSSSSSVNNQSNVVEDQVSTPNTKWVRNIITEQHVYYKKNPQLMLIFVGCLSFLMGHLGRDVFSFSFLASSTSSSSSSIVMQALAHLSSWFHILIILLLMIAITIIVNKILLFQVTLKVYSLWRDWLKFREMMNHQNEINDDKIENLQIPTTISSTSNNGSSGSSTREATKEATEDNNKRTTSVHSVKSHVNIGEDHRTTTTDSSETRSSISLPSVHSSPSITKATTTTSTTTTRTYSSLNHIPISKPPETGTSSTLSTTTVVKRPHSGEQLESFNDTDSSSDDSDSGSSVSEEEDTSRETRAPFMLFCQQTRPTLTEQNPTWTFFEMKKKLEEMWKNLSDKEKQVYQQMVQKLKEEHQ